MTVSKRRRTRAERLACRAWIAVACTPLGWAMGITLAFLGGEGEAEDIGPVALGILGVLLFAAAPATAVILAVQAARAGHRSGRILAVVSGSLLVATLALTLLVGWLGLVLAAVVAVLVAVWARPRDKPSPPGADGMRREGGSPAAPAQPGPSGRKL